VRRTVLTLGATLVCCVAFANPAWAGTQRLYMGEGPAFAVLGRWCGGIQQQVYVTGFSAHGYPTGNVHLQTTCGGSGRGGGGHSTTYQATASVEWTWFGETRSYGPIAGALEAKPAEDAFGDKVYNVGTAAYLEATNPPIKAPAPPTGIGTSVGLYEPSENIEYLRLSVAWTEAPETESLIKYSTVTATPVGSSAPVLTYTTSSNYFREAGLGPLEPTTTYRVTVTNTDAEGTSEPSAPVEIKTPNSDGEAEREYANNGCTSSSGSVKLSPGLTETPAVQSIVVKGVLSGCHGPTTPESGTFTVKEKTTEPVSCSYLQSASVTPTTTAGALAVKWLPAEEGSSKGTLAFPVSETGIAGLAGSLKGGPFETAVPVKAASVSESFTGAQYCGVPQGAKGVVKPVKAGSFSTGEVELH